MELITLPNKISQKIKNIDSILEESGYIGDTFESLIHSAINRNLLNVAIASGSPEAISESEIKLLKEISNSLQSYSDKIEPIRESVFVDTFPKQKDSINENQRMFWDKVSNSLNRAIDITILQETEAIESESPTNDQLNNEEVPQEEEQPEITPEQEFQLNLAQTDQKFVMLTLFNRINELLNVIKNIKENVYTSEAEDKIDLYGQLELYESYLEVLSDIIFVTDLNTVYYTYCNIALEVNALLDKYLISTKLIELNDKSSTKQERTNAIKDLIDNKESQNDSEEDMLQ